ncbi:MAG: hypothetical protein QOD03_1339 [Verrucomicrobiota bacterium]
MKILVPTKFRLILSSFALLASMATRADILDQWHWRNPSPFSDTMRSVCFANGKFVAVGDGGVIHTSSDGTAWDGGQRPVVSQLNKVIFAGGQFIAVGNHGNILTSSNGLNWASQSSGTTDDLLAIAYGNGLYMACGIGGRLVTSANGISWNVSSVGTGDLNWITFGNGVFLLPAPNQQLAVQVSTNGQNWFTPPSFPVPGTSWPNHQLYQVDFGNGVFVAAASDETGGKGSGGAGHFYHSSNGTNWIIGAYFNGWNGGNLGLGNSNHRFLSFADGWFNELTQNNAFPLTRTIDGTTAVIPPTNPPSAMADANQMAFGNGCYVVVGGAGKNWTSSDTTNWVSAYNGFRNGDYQISISQIIRGADNYIALAVAQPVLVAGEGMNFTAANSPTGILNAVGFDGSNYVAVGGSGGVMFQNGYVYTSTNATDWVQRTSNANKILKSVCQGPSRWVAVGKAGTVITSLNTLSWTLRTSGTASDLNGVAFGNNVYIAVGNGGTVINSADGIAWDVQFAGTTADLNRVQFLNGQFVAVGANGTILTSTDGATWTSQSSGIIQTFLDVAYGNGNYLVCGSSSGEPNVVLQSTNGSNWVNISSKIPTADPFTTVSFLNQSFWIGGANGAILQSDSTDGIPWIAGAKVPEGFQLRVTYNVPPIFRIQTSTNFSDINSWSDLASVTNSSTWNDIRPIGSAPQFYRILTP